MLLLVALILLNSFLVSVLFRSCFRSLPSLFTKVYFMVSDLTIQVCFSQSSFWWIAPMRTYCERTTSDMGCFFIYIERPRPLSFWTSSSCQSPTPSTKKGLFRSNYYITVTQSEKRDFVENMITTRTLLPLWNRKASRRWRWNRGKSYLKMTPPAHIRISSLMTHPSLNRSDSTVTRSTVFIFCISILLLFFMSISNVGFVECSPNSRIRKKESWHHHPGTFFRIGWGWRIFLFLILFFFCLGFLCFSSFVIVPRLFLCWVDARLSTGRVFRTTDNLGHSVAG